MFRSSKLALVALLVALVAPAAAQPIARPAVYRVTHETVPAIVAVVQRAGDYTHIVAEERARFGRPLGEENAWRVCNAVALRLRQLTGDDGWGLHRKGGTNFNGYAIDIVGHRSGVLYDVLGDAEGEGKPQWGAVPGNLSWAPPVGQLDPGPTDPGPGPGPGDPGTPADPGELAQLLERILMTQTMQVALLQEIRDSVRNSTAELQKLARDGIPLRFGR